MTVRPTYVLGSDDAEIVRLDRQARFLSGSTDLLLRSAGIAPGMRVLELGTGLGHVALALGGMVGDEGLVVAVDQDPRMLEVAVVRRDAVGAGNVELLPGDARAFRKTEPFDALVMRLLLFHLPDAVDVLHYHLLHNLRPGGMVVALDYDLGPLRCEPQVPLLAKAGGWVEAAFRSAGADPRVGARLIQLLREAGYEEVSSFGIQPYLAPDDPVGPAMLCGVVAALAPQIVAAGIATETELDLPTLEERLARALYEADATLLTPALAGAWGRRPR